MRLTEYMRLNFPNLELKPPLFYHWDRSICFELGEEIGSGHCYADHPYLEKVQKRAITLFKAIHSPKDAILL